MTVSKDVQNNRPPSQHRLSIGATASSLPARQVYGRTHSHSVSLGSINPQHRINRRKSSASFAPNNMAALAAAVKEASMDPSSSANRIKPSPRLGTSGVEPNASTSSYNNNRGSGAADVDNSATSGNAGSVLVDGPPLSMILAADKSASKARARRASEGSRLSKADSKRASAGDLRCETCGKGYKHGSCLTKHLWEHDPAWSYTSKLLISKHQQVQLLEAASVLVKMQDGSAPADSISALDSDVSSNSPAASGSSDLHDDDGSSRSSSPPLQDDSTRSGPVSTPHSGRAKRKDSYSSAFSQSYRSASAHSFAASSFPNEFSHRPWTPNSRPSTSAAALGIRFDHDDHADITAAAEGLLSCSLGTPIHGPTILPPDVPPVPPLPAKFASQASNPSTFGNGMSPNLDRLSRKYRAASEDVDMNEEDEGVFGQMDQ